MAPHILFRRLGPFASYLARVDNNAGTDRWLPVSDRNSIMCTLQDSIAGPLMENWAFARTCRSIMGGCRAARRLLLVCCRLAPPSALQEIIWGIETAAEPNPTGAQSRIRILVGSGVVRTFVFSYTRGVHKCIEINFNKTKLWPGLVAIALIQVAENALKSFDKNVIFWCIV